MVYPRADILLCPVEIQAQLCMLSRHQPTAVTHINYEYKQHGFHGRLQTSNFHAITSLLNLSISQRCKRCIQKCILLYKDMCVSLDCQARSRREGISDQGACKAMLSQSLQYRGHLLYYSIARPIHVYFSRQYFLNQSTRSKQHSIHIIKKQCYKLMFASNSLFRIPQCKI